MGRDKENRVQKIETREMAVGNTLMKDVPFKMTLIITLAHQRRDTSRRNFHNNQDSFHRDSSYPHRNSTRSGYTSTY